MPMTWEIAIKTYLVLLVIRKDQIYMHVIVLCFKEGRRTIESVKIKINLIMK